MSLDLEVCWNAYYKTALDSAAPQHNIAAVYQIQHGLYNHIWIDSQLANSPELGLDCQVHIQNLHPRLDGVRSVESIKPQDSIIVIKMTSQLSQTELCAIGDAIEQQLTGRPTIQIVSKVTQQVVLHQLTVDSLKCSAPDEQDLSVTELQQMLMQAARHHQAALQPQLHEQGASTPPHAQAGLHTNQYQPHVLPSRVLHRSSHQLGGQHANDAAGSSTTHVSMRLVSVCITILYFCLVVPWCDHCRSTTHCRCLHNCWSADVRSIRFDKQPVWLHAVRGLDRLDSMEGCHGHFCRWGKIKT